MRPRWTSAVAHVFMRAQKMPSFPLRVQTFERFISGSQKALLIGYIGEPIEGIAGTGAGIELRGPTHRVGNDFPGELWINMLSVSWASLKKIKTIYLSKKCKKIKLT